MDLMGQLPRMSKEDVLVFVHSCQHASGGFSPAPHHDPHLLYTLSAIQVRSHDLPHPHMWPHDLPHPHMWPHDLPHTHIWSHDLPYLPHVVT